MPAGKDYHDETEFAVYTTYRRVSECGRPMDKCTDSGNKGPQANPPQHTGVLIFLFAEFWKPVTIPEMQKYVICNQSKK